MPDPTTRFMTKANAKAFAQALKLAYTNQNAVGSIKVGEGTFTAAEAADQIELIEGSNVSITLSGDTITFAATDTTYNDAVASVSGVGGTSGLFTGAEKEKLAGIAAGAEVNQFAFSGITVGNSTVAAATKTDTFELVDGTNITLTVSGDKITIAATDTTYSAATPSTSGVGGTDGLLTAADKEKLNGIAAGADDNVIDTVKVNGSALTPDGSKAVDVTITTGDSGTGTIKVNGTSVTAYGLGTAAAATVETTGISSNTTTLATTAQVKEFVDSTVASAYKAAGSLAPSGVSSSLLVAANAGKVYNLSADMTLDSTSAALFVDGAANDVIEGGTNIVVVDAGSGTYKFDKLAGFVDLSPYQTIADLGGLDSNDMAEILAEL